jgi:minor extracellular serine protease Vpr
LIGCKFQILIDGKIFEDLNIMKLKLFSTRRKVFLGVLAFLFCSLAAAGVAFADESDHDRIVSQKMLSRMVIPGTQDLQLIVELSDPSVLERMINSASSGRSDSAARAIQRDRSMDFTTAEAQTHRQQVGRSQQSIKDRILQLSGTQIQGTTDIVMNAVIVRVPAARYSEIRRIPGVKKVYFSRPHRMLLDKAAAIQNAQALWAAVGGESQAGRGIKIGIIDTGIDITNPMFSPSGFTAPTGYPKYDNIADKAFTNTKVIAARNYISFLTGTQRVRTAIDEIGHGTFVAGCAAGEQVNAPLATIAGMAPGAFLGSYKIFGTPGINDTTTSAAIMAAINDAVADGMNVINLSIGETDYILPHEAPEVTVVENAVKAGVVVTIAAGNGGTSAYTIGSLGSAPSAITVGSVSNSRTFLATIRTTDPNLPAIGYIPSVDGPSITNNIGFTRVVDVESLDGDGLGCSTLLGSLNSSIALVKRGTCTFETKAANAAAAGATAVIIYNNEAFGIINMVGLSSSTIPAVMISNVDGSAFKQYIDANPGSAQAAIDNSQTLHAVPAFAQVVSSFSSLGPGTDFSLKPDLVAVGENVYSATEKVNPSGEIYDSSGFTTQAGTSFSAPMVAGAAAALRGLFPSLGPAAIKSLLTTTAGNNLTSDGSKPPNVLQAGSGLLNIKNASSAGAVFAPSNLSFGVHSYSGSLSLSSTFTIQNISNVPDQFTLGVEPIIAGPAISFSQSITDAVAPGSTASIDIYLQIIAPASGGFQGFIIVQSVSTSAIYRIPYWAGLYVPDSGSVLQVSKSTSGSGIFSDLADALNAAQPGNIIEIQDSATYPVGDNGLVISTNRQGLPLHGITIRAADGQIPIIDGSNSSSLANILVVGLQHVLLQGLTVNNGYTGIEIYQPSTTMPVSVTIDRGAISNSAGDILSAGVWIDRGGTVDVTHSTISGSSGTGIVASNAQLTLLGTTVQKNGFDGLEAYGTNVDIFNSTFSGNSGAGIYLDYCTGTIERNTIAQNQDGTYSYNGLLGDLYGDGVQIADGNLTIRKNLFDSNNEAGITLEAGDQTGLGPIVRIDQNTIRRNGYYGLYSEIASSIQADANLIEDNAGGVFLLDVNSGLFQNNLIVRSTDLSYGDGVVISGSSARLINNTIYQNRLNGVWLSSGNVAIANSIVSGNKSGDLQGVPSSSIQTSLISADPKFVNPALDDFSLAASSPAIDKGSNTVSDLSFLDFNGRLRVASLGAQPGQGTVDIGAVEANSAFPMLFPLVIQGDEPSVGEKSFITGLAMFNPSTSAIQVNFTGYNDAGGIIPGSKNPALVTLAANAQLPILDDQLFGFDPSGSYLGSSIASSQYPMAGFFLIFDKDFTQFATGANANSQTANDLVFMRHEFDSGGKARYAIFNPGVNAANATATLMNSAGVSVGQSKTAAIAPKGNLILNYDAANLASGYVRVQSDRPVSGLEVIGNANFLSALSAAAPGSDTRLFFPHFALGGGYSTRIGIVNSGASSTSLTLNAYDNSGNVIGSQASVALAAGGQLMQSVNDLFGISSGAMAAGYIVANSDQPGIVGFVDFSFNDGAHISDAALPADSVPLQHLIFADVAQGGGTGEGIPYATGIGLLNPFGTTVLYTISVFDGDGIVIAQKSDRLGPHEKVGKLLTSSSLDSGFFTQPIELRKGHIEVTTDYGLLGIGLFFASDLSQLASIPAQSGN